VRTRSIDRKEPGDGAHHGLTVSGDAPAKLGHESLSSGGQRWTRGKGARRGIARRFEASRARRGEKGRW
jgi:hypothetical protein